MSARDDDTALDALAAHARSHAELPVEELAGLITAARGGDRRARDTLVEQSLSAVLAEAMVHRDHGVEVPELFQEGSLAAVVAIDEYVGRGGSAERFHGYLREVVSGHLDRVVEREEAAATEAAGMVEDTRLLDVARVALRRQSGHEPTETELTAVLGWPPERVRLIAGILATAGEEFDADIVQYLDDEADQ